jgi:signal transduction histidine kinase
MTGNAGTRNFHERFHLPSHSEATIGFYPGTVAFVWIHGEVKILYDESGRPFMHGMGYDITELKHTQEDLRQSHDKEQRANRAKSEFLTRTSHELTTPLNIIMGFAEFLIESKLDPLDPKHKEYLQDI